MLKWTKFYTTVSLISLLIAGMLGGFTGTLPIITTFFGILALPTLVAYFCYKTMLSASMIKTAIKGGS